MINMFALLQLLGMVMSCCRAVKLALESTLMTGGSTVMTGGYHYNCIHCTEVALQKWSWILLMNILTRMVRIRTIITKHAQCTCSL